MNITALIDVVIGLSIIYLSASLFVTIINEYVAQIFQLRAKQLGENLNRLINGKEGVEALSVNPALAPFFQEDKIGGSYVDSRLVAEQLLGGLRKVGTSVASMKDFIEVINSMEDSELKKQLLALSQVANDNVDKFVDSVSSWIDCSLTMMGEVYKKRSQTMSFLIGLAIAVVFNIDTLGVASHLYREKEARDAIVTFGADFVQKTSKETLDRCARLGSQEAENDPGCEAVEQLLSGLQGRNEMFGKLPIGWPPSSTASYPVWMTVPIGWFLTALAISLGASFWFDLLNRVINMRNGMKKPDPAKSPTS